METNTAKDTPKTAFIEQRVLNKMYVELKFESLIGYCYNFFLFGEFCPQSKIRRHMRVVIFDREKCVLYNRLVSICGWFLDDFLKPSNTK